MPRLVVTTVTFYVRFILIQTISARRIETHLLLSSQDQQVQHLHTPAGDIANGFGETSPGTAQLQCRLPVGWLRKS